MAIFTNTSTNTNTNINTSTNTKHEHTECLPTLLLLKSMLVLKSL